MRRRRMMNNGGNFHRCSSTTSMLGGVASGFFFGLVIFVVIMMSSTTTSAQTTFTIIEQPEELETTRVSTLTIIEPQFDDSVDEPIIEHSIDPRGMVSIQRGVSPMGFHLANAMVGGGTATGGCNYVGTITLAGPSSLSADDKFYNIGNKQLTAFQLMVDYINRHRCGVRLKGSNYALHLETFDDQSSKNWTNAIGEYLTNDDDTATKAADILLGGYSSGLTAGLANVANQSSKLLLAPGAASTGVFKGRDKTFGSFPPTAKYTAYAVEALAKVGARKIASVWEDASFTRGVCAAIPALAQQHGLEVTSTTEVPSSPNVTVLENVALNMTNDDPDVVVTCVYDKGCQNWMQAMQNTNWSPRGQVFTVCVGLESFVDGAGDNAQYIMGITPWDQSLNVIDQVTGWSARDFAQRFMDATGDVDVTYHAASAASVISLAVQAMEKTNSLDPQVLADHIASTNFLTAYGDLSFDENGQSQAPSLLVQYDAEGKVQTVFPEEVSSGPILYPMPTWAERGCQRTSRCVLDGNECNAAGQCVCQRVADEYSVGLGSNAQCIPQEEMNYISDSLHATVYLMTSISLSFALMAAVWTYHHRNDMLVKVSQPLCLGLVILGCVMSTISMIPMGYETGYRESSDDIRRADAACMAVPWLWGLGFTITFSSLFAKILRVKKLFGAASGFRRNKVGMSLIFQIMGTMLAVELSILISFQVVSPQRWERDVLDTMDGFPIESEGHCTSDHGWWFWLALTCFKILSLVIALVLCFQTRNIPSDFAETTHIFLAVMFMFQVILLAVPVSAMVRDNPDVFFFIRASAVFMQNFTVLVIIFVPKMLRIYRGEDTAANVRKSIAVGVSRRKRNTTSAALRSDFSQSLMSSIPDFTSSNLDLNSSNPDLSNSNNNDLSGQFSIPNNNNNPGSDQLTPMVEVKKRGRSVSFAPESETELTVVTVPESRRGSSVSFGKVSLCNTSEAEPEPELPAFSSSEAEPEPELSPFSTMLADR